jgi:integrase
LDRKNLEKLEVGIKRDPSTRILVAETKVNVDGKFEKIYRDWPSGKDGLEGARLWRSVVKTQHRLKHPTMKLRSNGTWVVRMPATDKYQAFERDFGYEFSQAKDWATDTYSLRLRGKWTDGTQTVESVWNCYLADGKLPSGSTLHSYEAIWRNDLSTQWGPVLVNEITAKQVQRWIDGWSASVPKLEHAHRVLRLVLSHAVDEDLIPYNPAFARQLPKRTKPKSFAIPKHKLQMIQDYPTRESDRLALALAIQSGLRFSEWSVLRVNDVDVENLLVTVDEHQARDRDGKLKILAGHKTSKEEKTANITPELASRIEALIADNCLSGGDLLFPAPSGKPWRYNNYRTRVWEPARIAAGVPKVKHMTGTHTTRRSTVTVSHQAGLTSVDIQGQTKHAGTRIIDDRYLQVAEGSGSKVAEAVHSAIGLPR